MRKVEKVMWRNILGRTPCTLCKGNLEVLPLDKVTYINLYGCRLATITFFDTETLSITFKGDCWDGASSTVMSRVRALCVGYRVSKSYGDVTFTSLLQTAVKYVVSTDILSEKGYTLLVKVAEVRLETQP